MKTLRTVLLCVLVSGCTPQFVDAVGVPAEPDAGSDAAIDAAPPPRLPPSLFHRYRFDGMGTVVWDERGGAHGTVVGGPMLSGAGSLTVAGLSSEQYVDLPNRIVSGLRNATIEVWVVWDGGPDWQRIFDFGNSDLGEGNRGGGTRYMFLTARATDSGSMRLAYSLNGFLAETQIDGDGPLPERTETHLVVVVDEQPAMSLYLNGLQVGVTTPIPGGLWDIDDVNNWLGRSNFANDSGFVGTFYEFRIYDSAMSADEALRSYAAGMDAVIE